MGNEGRQRPKDWARVEGEESPIRNPRTSQGVREDARALAGLTKVRTWKSSLTLTYEATVHWFLRMLGWNLRWVQEWNRKGVEMRTNRSLEKFREKKKVREMGCLARVQDEDLSQHGGSVPKCQPEALSLLLVPLSCSSKVPLLLPRRPHGFLFLVRTCVLSTCHPADLCMGSTFLFCGKMKLWCCLLQCS